MSASAWDRAGQAAAKAICEGMWATEYSDTARRMADDFADVALAAALPVLLDELAQRIEAEASDREPPWHSPPEVEQARSRALSWAARIIRGFAAEVTQ